MIRRDDINSKKYKNSVRKQPLIFSEKDIRVIVSIDANRWHLSASCSDRLPTYHEMKKLRYEHIPDKAQMAMIFPPKSEFVNVHENCLHLWEIKE